MPPPAFVILNCLWNRQLFREISARTFASLKMPPMRQTGTLIFLLLLSLPSFAKKWPSPKFSGMYFQWGYNREVYSKSDLHFENGAQYNFTLHNVVAHDKPDFSAFRTSPWDITIPQNSFRIGVYLNPKHTWAVEFNFDHFKYVMDGNQQVRMTGRLGETNYDKDTTLVPQFVKFEHTDGVNLYHINFVRQQEIWKRKDRTKATFLYKIGGGVGIPRTEVSLFGEKLNNKYHLAGYTFAGEAGLRFYPTKNFFLELNGKAGFANYLTVLTVEGGHANHKFLYAGVVGLIGYDIGFGSKKVPMR